MGYRTLFLRRLTVSLKEGGNRDSGRTRMRSREQWCCNIPNEDAENLSAMRQSHFGVQFEILFARIADEDEFPPRKILENAVHTCSLLVRRILPHPRYHAAVLLEVDATAARETDCQHEGVDDWPTLVGRIRYVMKLYTHIDEGGIPFLHSFHVQSTQIPDECVPEEFSGAG